MSTVLISLFAFIIGLSLLIAVHEFGHFWVARRLGVKVLRFSIGFGKPLWGVRSKAGTEFVVAAIPLGGYVKMLDEREGEVAANDLPFAFNRQSVGRRMLIVCAGPFFNMLFAVVAYWLMYMIGFMAIAPVLGGVLPGSIAERAGLQAGHEIVAVGGRTTNSWQDVNFELISRLGEKGSLPVTVQEQGSEAQQQRILDLSTWEVDPASPDLIGTLGFELYRPVIPAKIGEVTLGDPAYQAGLQAGDEVLAVEGEPIHDWFALVAAVQLQPEQEISMTLLRGEEIIDLIVTPSAVEGEDDAVYGFIGVRPEPWEWPADLWREQRYGPIKAFVAGIKETGAVTVLSLRTLGKMVFGQVSVRNLSGPISIAKGAGETARVGLSYYLGFLALISISLGIINMLPIPVLDGGHFLYYVIEAVRGKPLSEAAQAAGMRVGLFLLLVLMVFAFYNDIARF